VSDKSLDDQAIIDQIEALLCGQPPHVKELFQFCLCQMMVEAGKMELVAILPGNDGRLCQFRTVVGETFVIPYPNMPSGTIDALRPVLREILSEETDWLD
jgi:hypothetical protein